MGDVTVIGGGLAGCEAAYRVARLGGKATLYEMKPRRFSPAHKLDGLAELVCSNSLKSVSLENSSGLLKEEMRRLGSIVVEAAEATSVPAGKALAVDREAFSAYITKALTDAGVELRREEVTALPPSRPLVIATGPLTSDGLAAELKGFLGSGNLYFYDAIAPIIYKDSINFDVAFMGSRYGKGGDDYVNCPMTGEEYHSFVEELTGAERVALRAFEKIPFFEGCMPVETMADRGLKTLSFGPMKPVGFTDPRTGRRPAAIVQLRRENSADSLYNMVGFQTRLTHPEQKRVFSLIPGLERASFARLGSIHRNSYIDSPNLLLPTLQLKGEPSVFFAGQLTGVEGYCESAVSGIIAGINAWKLSSGREPVFPPPVTMTGALLRYITEPVAGKGAFQPMNANFGLLSRWGRGEGGKGGEERKKGKEREKGKNGKERKRKAKEEAVERALSGLSAWMDDAGNCK
ncbi:MAG: methylenetetrahydrofolate--tRNA-(uracil(54)-C(5))-methyltransferase (FADH(2)-oxidizing) TrmFO [Thermodesulfobacteriota bacterium]